jgi:hypothetical protein
LVDFEKLNEDLKSIYDTLQRLKSGEQNREFSEDVYKQLITANKDLKDEFIQMGDQYIYIGSSMQLLTGALEENTLALLGEAK